MSTIAQDKEDEIKGNIEMAYQSCNEWKFQIHWNKLEQVNPRSCMEGKNYFCISTKKFILNIVIDLTFSWSFLFENPRFRIPL